MQELKIAKVRAGHHIAVKGALAFAATHDLPGLRFLFRILEEAVPAQRLRREADRGPLEVLGAEEVGFVGGGISASAASRLRRAVEGF